MNCCGKKRQELHSSNVNPRLQHADNARVTIGESDHLSQNIATFRYIGNQSLRIKSVFDHRVYNFSVYEPELTVMAEDVAMMRGYSDLVEMKIY